MISTKGSNFLPEPQDNRTESHVFDGIKQGFVSEDQMMGRIVRTKIRNGVSLYDINQFNIDRISTLWARMPDADADFLIGHTYQLSVKVLEPNHYQFRLSEDETSSLIAQYTVSLSSSRYRQYLEILVRGCIEQTKANRASEAR